MVKKCKDCGIKLGLFSKKIKYDNLPKKEIYYICKKCYSKRKPKEEKLANKIKKDMEKAITYATENNINIIDAYKKLGLGDFKKKD